MESCKHFPVPTRNGIDWDRPVQEFQINSNFVIPELNLDRPQKFEIYNEFI